MSLSEALAQAQSARCLKEIAQRYRLTDEQAQHAANTVRPMILKQIEAALTSENGALELLHTFKYPAFAEIERAPSTIHEQSIRLVGDAIHRQLARYDNDIWSTLDDVARQIGVSHQALRAMVPCLTLLVVGALRRATIPAFLRLLQHHRPNDTSTDPFAFACDHADALKNRAVQPKTALRWLDLVLSRTDAHHTALRADPTDRIR